MKILRNKESFLNIGLLLLSILLVFVAGELALRLYHSAVFVWKNFLEETLDLNRSAYPSKYDAVLGWTPEENFSGNENVWKTQVTTNENGIRLNGNTKQVVRTKDHVILVVGNSFTFGDEVSDHQTWPSYLEKLLGKSVINGGVFGYGLDQMYLRAKQLIPKYEPEILIVGFIPDDILRCKLRVRMGTPKPYFRVIENELILENTPVPVRNHQLGKMDFYRKYFGYSLFFNFLMKRIYPSYWLFGSHYENISTGEDEIEIACRILEQLNQIQVQKSIDVVILIQYSKYLSEEEQKIVKALNSCLMVSDFTIINLYRPLKKIKNDEPEYYQTLFDNHMTPAGNDWIARQISQELTKRDLVR